MSEKVACRSVSADGRACDKPRGHKKPVHVDRDGAEWNGGINTPAQKVYVDNGYMTEADYQTWGRL